MTRRMVKPQLEFAKCEVCGKILGTIGKVNPNQRYCSPKCTQLAYRKRKAEGLVIPRKKESVDQRMRDITGDVYSSSWDEYRNSFLERKARENPEEFCSGCGCWYFPPDSSGYCAMCRGRQI